MNFFNKSVFTAWLLLIPVIAHAYIGPGAGLGAIGTAIAFLGALILLVVGFVWYPVKRILIRRKAVDAQGEKDKTQNKGDEMQRETDKS